MVALTLNAGPSVGSPAHLLKSQPGVVRRRDGTVLTKNSILKTGESCPPRPTRPRGAG